MTAPAALLPELDRDLRELEQAFPGSTVTVSPDRRLVVRATVRGTKVLLSTDLHTWPAHPPEIRIVGADRVLHPLVSPGGRVRGLACVRGWNRTFDFNTVLRELDLSFRAQPPLVNPTVGQLLVRLLRGLLV